jgi:hypothetical protein
MRMLGFLAFLVGFILAVVAGLFFFDQSWVLIVLLLLGLLIGLLNVNPSEVLPFMVAAIALVVVGNVFTPITTMDIGVKLGHIMTLIAALMAPAAIVVAIKTLYQASKPE